VLEHIGRSGPISCFTTTTTSTRTTVERLKSVETSNDSKSTLLSIHTYRFILFCGIRIHCDTMSSINPSYIAPIASGTYLSGNTCTIFSPLTQLTFYSGAIASFSLAGLPALIRHLRNNPPSSPNRTSAERHALSIFREIYQCGKENAPPIALVSAGLSLINGYQLYCSAGSFVRPAQLAVAAAVLNMAIVPFTLFVIAPTNNLLFAREEAWRTENEEVKAKMVKNQSGLTTEALLNRWRVQNWVRSLFPLIGAVLAYQAC
jgi:hypothetical protein